MTPMTPFDDAELGAWILVRSYPKTCEDGQPVNLYECRMPARFYRIAAMASADSVSAPMAGFTLETGSGCRELAESIAKAIAGGMLGLLEKEILR